MNERIGEDNEGKEGLLRAERRGIIMGQLIHTFSELSECEQANLISYALSQDSERNAVPLQDSRRRVG
jgi:hypothetical protein